MKQHKLLKRLRGAGESLATRTNTLEEQTTQERFKNLKVFVMLGNAPLKLKTNIYFSGGTLKTSWVFFKPINKKIRGLYGHYYSRNAK